MSLNLLKTIKYASDIEPKLNELLAGRRIEFMEWHDGHGDVIAFHLDDKTVITICTTYNLANQERSPDPHKLHIRISKEE